uniref:Uncharacterized protein n=1 Tax=Strigamia maritima TaxID=126957 RepID=T1ITW9_STRMM
MNQQYEVINANVIPVKPTRNEGNSACLLLVACGTAQLVLGACLFLFCLIYLLIDLPFSIIDDNRLNTLYCVSLMCGVYHLISSVLIISGRMNPERCYCCFSNSTLLAIVGCILFVVVDLLFCIIYWLEIYNHCLDCKHFPNTDVQLDDDCNKCDNVTGMFFPILILGLLLAAVNTTFVAVESGCCFTNTCTSNSGDVTTQQQRRACLEDSSGEAQDDQRVPLLSNQKCNDLFINDDKYTNVVTN